MAQPTQREIVLDTETTGFDPRKGDRIVEIGCVELIDLIPTGKTFHAYLNPERSMPASAFAVHGLSDDFLADKPLFPAIAPEFLDFIQDSPLVIHNASFDMAFLDFELLKASHAALGLERAVDTVKLARKRFPGLPNKLDDLIARFNIDGSRRVKHGALLDAELLAEVYLELKGGRQSSMVLGQAGSERRQETFVIPHGERPHPLSGRLSEDEKKRHRTFIDLTLGDKALWHKTEGFGE